MKNKILIAGSTGFIGTHLFNYLRDKYYVYGIGSENLTMNNYSKIDLTNISDVEKFVSNMAYFDILIFLTGLAHSKGKNKNYDEFYDINVNTLKNLLLTMKLWKKLPFKIIFSSTISTYGEILNKNYYTEDDLQIPQSPYAKTKLEAEKYILKEFKEVSWILRFAPVYANNFTLNIDRRTKYKNKFYYVGKGDAKLSMLSIDNIKKTINSILKGDIPSGIYNLSDNKVYNYYELLEWYNAKNKVFIPKSIIYLVYLFGKIINRNYLVENCIKLISDNIYPSEKISKYINLTSYLKDINNLNNS